MAVPFTLGMNYWPGKKAMSWWRDFDSAEVREDFTLIKETGMDVVRIFLLWDDFQPDPDSVEPSALSMLEKTADIASEKGLGLDITFFTGHMSGPNFAPRWLLGGKLPSHDWIRDVVSEGRKTEKGYRNMFHDAKAIGAERLLLETVVGALKNHPGVWMWNLGNEPDLFAWPDSSEKGAEWIREMTESIKRIDKGHPVTIGLHGDSLVRDNGLRIDTAYRHTDVAVMHSYPMYSPLARHPLDPDYVPFTCALTAALSGKPVLMEEFGGCTAPRGEASRIMKWKETNGTEREQFMAGEEEFAVYLALVLPKLRDSGATGAMLWCFSDYAPELWDSPPCLNSVHERYFGMTRADGSLKPHAKIIRDFAKTRPTVLPIPDYARIVIDADRFYGNPQEILPSLYAKYLEDAESCHGNGNPRG